MITYFCFRGFPFRQTEELQRKCFHVLWGTKRNIKQEKGIRETVEVSAKVQNAVWFSGPQRCLIKRVIYQSWCFKSSESSLTDCAPLGRICSWIWIRAWGLADQLERNNCENQRKETYSILSHLQVEQMKRFSFHRCGSKLRGHLLRLQGSRLLRPRTEPGTNGQWQKQRQLK